MVRFADPFWLVFLILAAVPWVAYRRRSRLSWPTFDGFTQPGSSSWVSRLAVVPVLLRSLAIGCMVVGLGRPQTAGEQIRISGRGVAIALVIDRSSSMKTTDFPAEGATISRFDAAKRTLGRFLEARSEDLIGVVAFANFPDTIAPPRLDRRLTWGAIEAMKTAGPADDGTDIGGAIAWGLGMIRSLPVQRKVLVLLTDGRHAPGASRSLDPIVAAEVARGLGITLHTVAVGRPPAVAPTPPAADQVGPPPPPRPPGDLLEGPDVDLLKRLADRGNGKAFVAADLEALGRIFRTIDALEKSTIEGTIRTIYHEQFAPWVLAALLLLGMNLGLSSGRFRRIP